MQYTGPKVKRLKLRTMPTGQSVPEGPYAVNLPLQKPTTSIKRWQLCRCLWSLLTAQGQSDDILTVPIPGWLGGD